ncbi:protoporphyrinogen oxidase, putative [Ixodes scapularis]|uniref:Protoporphyrinogen oxidase, putative n=1 Tax=Ixodes scapularis TaxID=6945 RepID=B7QJ20_IXOSC|nr:protoporphyrinogen oxidase, putative [Ixodes scapularis]|eukprot:XP_002415177.1 protoporphyrinogen oxidase, putative [Ixodes scapularis]
MHFVAIYCHLLQVEELGLHSQVLPVASSSPAGKQQLVLAKGRLGPLPISFGRLLWPGSPFTTPLLVPLLKDLFWAGTPGEDQDESVHDFTVRRFNRQVRLGKACSALFSGKLSHFLDKEYL